MPNGRIHETFGISKHFPVKLHISLLNAETLKPALSRQLKLHAVCALHEHHASAHLL